MLSLVIPVYRSAASINPLYEAIVRVLEREECEFELIFIEDCGGDDSWNLIRLLAAKDDRVRGLKLTRNFGQHYAITAGLDASAGDWVITMDCDLQDDPAHLPALLEATQSGYDVVLVRRIDRDDGWANRVTSQLFYKVFDTLSGSKTDPTVGSFRCMSRRVVDKYCAMPERHRFFGGLIQWMGYPTASIDLPRRQRQYGTSSYNYYKRLKLGLDAVLSFSDRPLKLMVLLGGLTSLLAVIYAVVIVVQRLTGQIAEIGFASIVVSLYLLSGLILMSIGLVGVYVGRIYKEVKGRPYYLIAEDTIVCP